MSQARQRLEESCVNVKSHRKTLILSLCEYQQQYPNSKEAMVRAYQSGGYTMAGIGNPFGVHYMSASRAVWKFQKSNEQHVLPNFTSSHINA